MATLKEEAEAYEPRKTKNIADLDEVPVDINIQEHTGLDDDGKEFTYKFFELNGEDYRVPNSVLKTLKEIMKEKPELKKIKVTKSGEGFKTTYTVIEK